MSHADQLPRPRAMHPERRQAARHQLEDVVGGRAPRRPWWRSGVAVAIGVAAIMVGGAASWYVASRPVTDKSLAYCYTAPSLGAGRGAVASVRPGKTNSQVDNPISACAALWHEGFYVPGVDHLVHLDHPTPTHPVPPLVVCTLPGGAAGVFPGGPGTCARLGLPKPKPPAE
ncbi:MAG: hypothetical protein ACRDZQ_09555 [Acidimicrobiales bacterium]